ncbi:MAG: DNA primase [Planctomycetaceae bacterium]|nr:DNA primase [Planctomycetaceae bacterium]
MSLADLQDAKEQVRQAIDIVDLVGGYIALRRQGRNFVGLCPWHDDSKPSLQVNQQRQSFKCWVCDIGGDIFSFIMKAEGVEFREALEMLAERAGVQLRQSPGGGGPQADNPFERKNLLRAMQWAEAQFHKCLLNDPAAEPARRYLADRGVSAESIERFQLGFSPPQWSWLKDRGAAAGFSPAVLERVGLLIKNEDKGSVYDRYRGRVMFSIRDVRSRPIAFGGRVLPELADDRAAGSAAKYINSPETPLFSKSRELYALDLARDGVRDEGGLLVMEGYTDVIMAHQHGVRNAVAVLGTALGERHVPLIRRFTDTITLVLDGDAAGQARTMDILDNLLALLVENEVELQILSLPSGADPCDVILSQGSEAFRQLLANAADALQYKIDAVTNGLASAPGTHRAAQAVEAILATLARALPAASPTSTALLRQEQVLSRVARQFGLTIETLRDRLVAVRREQRTKLNAAAPVAAPRPAQQARPVADPNAMLQEVDEEGELAAEPASFSAPAATPTMTTRPTAWDREVLQLLLHHPERAPELFAAIAAEDFASEAARVAYAAVSHLDAEGEPLTYDAWMLALDDLAAKNLLVDCDEEGEQKSAADVNLRVRDVLGDLQRRRDEVDQQQRLVQFRTRRFDQPEQEDQALLDFYRSLGQKPPQGSTDIPNPEPR